MILLLLMGTTFALCVAGAAAFWINGATIGPPDPLSKSPVCTPTCFT